MAKQKGRQTDTQKADELLQKLQKAVLSTKEKQKKKADIPDADELAFQNKIAAMLQKAAAAGSAKDSPKKPETRSDTAPDAKQEKPDSDQKDRGKEPKKEPIKDPIKKQKTKQETGQITGQDKKTGGTGKEPSGSVTGKPETLLPELTEETSAEPSDKPKKKKAVRKKASKDTGKPERAVEPEAKSADEPPDSGKSLSGQTDAPSKADVASTAPADKKKPVASIAPADEKKPVASTAPAENQDLTKTVQKSDAAHFPSSIWEVSSQMETEPVRPVPTSVTLPETEPVKPVPPSVTLPETEPVKPVPPSVTLPKTEPVRPVPTSVTLPETESVKPVPTSVTLPKTEPVKPVPPSVTSPKTEPVRPVPPSVKPESGTAGPLQSGSNPKSSSHSIHPTPSAPSQKPTVNRRPSTLTSQQEPIRIPSGKGDRSSPFKEDMIEKKNNPVENPLEPSTANQPEQVQKNPGSSSSAESESIVISPPASHQKNQPIVIKPRQTTSQAAPTRVQSGEDRVSLPKSEGLNFRIGDASAPSAPSPEPSSVPASPEAGASSVQKSEASPAPSGKESPHPPVSAEASPAPKKKGIRHGMSLPRSQNAPRFFGTASAGQSVGTAPSSQAAQAKASPPAEAIPAQGESVSPSASGKTVKKPLLSKSASGSASKSILKPASRPTSKPAQKPVSKKRRPARIKDTTIAPLPEDENLDEALEEIVSDEAQAEILPMEEPEVLTGSAKKASVFSRRKAKKEEESEEAMNAASIIEQKTGITKDDLAMIFELGYENELGRLVGYETLKKLKFEHIRNSRKMGMHHYRTSFGYRKKEYNGTQPKEKILASYAHDKRDLILRTVFTALLVLCLIPLEIPSLFGGYLTPYTEAYPHLFPILSCFVTVLGIWLSARQLYAGLRSFFRFTPSPYSALAIAVPLSLCYSIASLFLGGFTLSMPANLPTLSLLLLSCIWDTVRISDEMRSFRIVSAEGNKHLLDASEPRKKKLRQGDKIVKIINDDVGQNLYRIRESQQVSGFFRRNNDFTASAKSFAYLICISLGLTFLGTLAGAILTDSLSGAARGFAMALCFTVPAPASFLFFDSRSRANRILYRKNCTLVGEESVEEYSRPKTLIFKDSEMYTAEKCTQISVKSGEDYRKDMQIAGILFRKMSGTLGSVGQNSPMKGQDDPSVAFIRMTENGTEAVVDGHHVLAGNADFMRRSGVRVPKESTDRMLRRTKNTSLMYVAINGTLKLSYEIEYTLSETFEQTVAFLAENKTAVAIQTYDPNINDSFLKATRTEGSDYVRVIKPGRYEKETVWEVADSGAVALGGNFDVIEPIAAANKIHSIREHGFRWQFFGSLIGAVLSVLLGIYSDIFYPGVAVAAPILFQILETAVAFIYTRVRLSPHSTSQND